MRNLHAWRVILLGLVLAGVPGTTVASTGTFVLGQPVNASGTSPFLGCPFGVDPDAPAPEHVYDNTEVEPFVAVNPTNHANIIGVYQQDRWTDGGSKGLVASRSFDGGAS